ncbi:hypothetical protein JNUCC0626_42075 [Lentzea sp. JNUCC 0626]|uniref:hypothetical protein n=1 Tax=Lentzea sp. JNUCC 0626 TaxID=3367513 RepID=UPI003747EBC5
MSRFEDNLWTRLETEHAPALLKSVAAQRRHTTKLRIAAAAAGVAVLGGVSVVAPAYFGGTPPAYAVVDNPDGSVTLTVRDLRQVDKAAQELRERGINAVAVPLRKECPPEEEKKIANSPKAEAEHTGEGFRMRFERADGTVVLASTPGHDEIVRVDAKGSADVPTCVVGVPPGKTIIESAVPVGTR